MWRHNKHRKWIGLGTFTLMELLVVIANMACCPYGAFNLAGRLPL
jgi:hypothetical protein